MSARHDQYAEDAALDAELGMPTGELPGLRERLHREQRQMDVYDDLGGDAELCARGDHPDLDDQGYCLACGAYTDPYGIT